jgi:hypothetical protein
MDALCEDSIPLALQYKRRRFVLEINQSEARIACDAIYINGSSRNEQSL